MRVYLGGSAYKCMHECRNHVPNHRKATEKGRSTKVNSFTNYSYSTVSSQETTKQTQYPNFQFEHKVKAEPQTNLSKITILTIIQEKKNKNILKKKQIKNTSQTNSIKPQNHSKH